MTSKPENPAKDWLSSPPEELVVKLNSAILDVVDRGNSMPVLLIDGPAAAGKSTLAKALQNELFRLGESAPRLIHMDDLYLGWNGLADGAAYLVSHILAPLKDARSASWQVFDWAAGRRDCWREFSGGTPLIIEGCGSISAKSVRLADFTVWVDAPEELRYQRWVAREGDDKHWASWRSQELDFYARENSKALAQHIYWNPSA